MTLSWLPAHGHWNEDFSAARTLPPEAAARRLLQLAQYSLDFIQTARLDKALNKLGAEVRNQLQRSHITRLAVIGSSTLAHLAPGIRVAAIRRGLWIEVFEGHYGSYHQELADQSSDLYAFAPDVVLIALDAHHVASAEEHQAGHTIETLMECWHLAKHSLGASVIQQTIMSIFPALMGNNEHAHPASALSTITRVNQELRIHAASEHVAVLSVDWLTQQDGISPWFQPALWYRFKQEVHPGMSHVYGDHVARLLAARRGLSYKCLVLDLDNTLWGGVIGDDGMDGIQLGQGHAVGEAFSSFQRYVKALGDRGVILAVCSKNDHEIALGPFERHSEMVLRRKDIACFIANWEDKATNLRTIAGVLDIGLDSVVFVDDNPFERNLVRQHLPMVAVPEMPDEPAHYARTVAAAGYFEAIELTSEDHQRNQLYLANAQRQRVRAATPDISEYLRSLDMRLFWSSFQGDSLSRVTQLINRSNQFNLTTRRYTHQDVQEMADNASVLTLQLRLVDAFGDNGLIGVVIGKVVSPSLIEIDTWLMSCRVLGRQVEEATLNLLVDRARAYGATELTGVYIPTAKNGIVRQHYARLGFERITLDAQETSAWRLNLSDYVPRPTMVHSVVDTTSSSGGAGDAGTDLQPAYASVP